MGQLVFQAALGGQVNLVGPNTASNVDINVPAFAGTMASLASVNNNGIAYVNSSGQPTTLSTFVFDGTNVGIGTASPTAYGTYRTIELKGTGGGIVQFGTAGTTGAYVYSDGTNSGFNNLSSGYINFATANVERVRIDSSGNVAIGTTATAGQQLTIASSGSSAAANAFYVYNSTPVALFTIRNDGAIFTGTAPSSPYNLTTASAANMFVDSNGVVYRGGVSALKYKQNIRDLENIDINKFRAVRYNSKCKNDNQAIDYFGIIADEVDAVGIKELVIYGKEDEVEGFQYERLTVVLLKAIQEQQALIQSLTTRITALETK